MEAQINCHYAVFNIHCRNFTILILSENTCYRKLQQLGRTNTYISNSPTCK